MRASLLALLAAAAVIACPALVAARPQAADGDKFVGGYILLSRQVNGKMVGLAELEALASKAATLPLTRLWISFVLPTLVYLPGSKTLEDAGLLAADNGDYGFARIKSAVATLEASGIETFLSMGGWNYNCFPYAYMRYSVGGYGTQTPNYWKIQQYGGGNLDNCNTSNEFCYVCEPPSENVTLASFSMFPEPTFSPTFQQAVKYVEAHQNTTFPPQWNADMIPGHAWVDTKTGQTLSLPGSDKFYQMKRDPYADIVFLASDLGVSGIDLDYEEFWHADLFKVGDGPWNLPETVYKYAAIAKDIQLNIIAYAPHLKLSTAASAVGGWDGPWWGGNLKGLLQKTNALMPDMVQFMSTGANAGGLNVMSYDLSDNPMYHECPSDNICALDKQVDFFMKTYDTDGMTANVGYEIGTPAYPSAEHDKEHQLPLTNAMLSSITTSTQPRYGGGFIWELFKPADAADQASATQTLQAICNTVLPGNARCSGTIPPAPTV